MMLKFFGSSDIKYFVERYFRARDDMCGKRVADLPAGKGYISRVLHEVGAEVSAYDLFPEFFEVEGLKCREADLTEQLPIADGTFDIVLCQEGIEHLPDQLAALREFHRILAPGGTLIVTTPNISHLRARVSYLFTESELWKRMPPNELDAVWHAGSGKTYFGHIFLINMQKLRILAVAAGFRLTKVHTVKASVSALLLAFLYPLIALVNWRAYRRNLRKDDGLDVADKRRVYGEIVRLNLNPTILFGRHLFVEFEKGNDDGEVELYVNRRD